jgi:hypothetical protein
MATGLGLVLGGLVREFIGPDMKHGSLRLLCRHYRTQEP